MFMWSNQELYQLQIYTQSQPTQNIVKYNNENTAQQKSAEQKKKTRKQFLIDEVKFADANDIG